MEAPATPTEGNLGENLLPEIFVSCNMAVGSYDEGAPARFTKRTYEFPLDA